MFHTVRSTYKNDRNMNVYYKSCLQKVLSDNVKSIAFCYGTIQPKYSRMDQVKFVESSVKQTIPFKFFKGCLPQILLGPFLNTLF